MRLLPSLSGLWTSSGGHTHVPSQALGVPPNTHNVGDPWAQEGWPRLWVHRRPLGMSCKDG